MHELRQHERLFIGTLSYFLVEQEAILLHFLLQPRIHISGAHPLSYSTTLTD